MTNPIEPDHYRQHPSGIRCIDLIEHLDLNLGVAAKYLWRAGLKEGVPAEQDLQKALWYLRRHRDLVASWEDGACRNDWPKWVQDAWPSIEAGFPLRIGRAMACIRGLGLTDADRDDEVSRAEVAWWLDHAEALVASVLADPVEPDPATVPDVIYPVDPSPPEQTPAEEMADTLRRYTQLVWAIHYDFGYEESDRGRVLGMRYDPYANWFLAGSELITSPRRITNETLAAGEYGSSELYTTVHQPKSVYRKDGHTMVLVDTNTDFNVYAIILSDENEQPEMVATYRDRRELVRVPIQVNGVAVSHVTVTPLATEDEVQTAIASDEAVRAQTEGKVVKKFLYVPGKLVSLVVA